MFPTIGKDKIPKSFSYPVNAKLISEALTDVPQADELSIIFYLLSTSAFREGGSTCSVLKVQYYHREVDCFTPHSWEEKEVYKWHWQIYIQPVPTTIKHHIQDLLLSQGFPKVRDWLRAHAHLKQTVVMQRIEVLYNRDFDRLEYQEYQHP